MRHRHAGVALSISQSCDQSNSNLGHQFANENDASSRPSTHIETQIYLFKRLVKRDRMSKHPRLVEFEPDEADVALMLVLIQHSSRRNKRFQEIRLSNI